MASGLLDHSQSLPSVPPVLSSNGQTVVFQMTGADTLNPDGSRELFAAQLPTTAVAWLELGAAWVGGTIQIRWRVSADDDHAFFMVVRAVGTSGPWELVNGPVETTRGRYEFHDPEPTDSRPWYRVDAVDRQGRLTSSTPIRAPIAPNGVWLSVGPNPTRGTTWIEVHRTQPGRIRLDILSVSGRLVRRLVDDLEAPGTHRYQWTGEDEAGNRVAPGIYFIRAGGMAARSIVRLP